MKFLTRWLFRCLILGIIIMVAFLLLKDVLLRSYLIGQIRSETGLDAKIGHAEIGLFTPTLSIDNFKLFNQPEFGGTPFIDLPDFFVEYDRKLLGQGRLLIRLMRLDIAEINIVKNPEGRLNIEGFQGALIAAFERSDSPFFFTGIDVLNLSVGKLRYITQGSTPNVKEITINLKHEVIRDVKSVEDLIQKILWQKGFKLFSSR